MLYEYEYDNENEYPRHAEPVGVLVVAAALIVGLKMIEVLLYFDVVAVASHRHRQTSLESVDQHYTLASPRRVISVI